jgi:hypothetical protein
MSASQRRTKLCEKCGAEFHSPPRRYEKARFCSPECYGRPRPSPPAEVRFWAKVDRSGGPDACWPWIGHRNPMGYGKHGIGRKGNTTVLSHRTAWGLANGQPPGELLVCHKCDNPPCCNPAHLFLGTHTDNAADMVRKRRNSAVVKPERVPRGERHGNAKLTADRVREIRALRSSGIHMHEIGRRFGVSHATVSRVLSSKIWSHVE